MGIKSTIEKLFGSAAKHTETFAERHADDMEDLISKAARRGTQAFGNEDYTELNKFYKEFRKAQLADKIPNNQIVPNLVNTLRPGFRTDAEFQSFFRTMYKAVEADGIARKAKTLVDATQTATRFESRIVLKASTRHQMTEGLDNFRGNNLFENFGSKTAADFKTAFDSLEAQLKKAGGIGSLQKAGRDAPLKDATEIANEIRAGRLVTERELDRLYDFHANRLDDHYKAAPKAAAPSNGIADAAFEDLPRTENALTPSSGPEVTQLNETVVPPKAGSTADDATASAGRREHVNEPDAEQERARAARDAAGEQPDATRTEAPRAQPENPSPQATSPSMVGGNRGPSPATQRALEDHEKFKGFAADRLAAFGQANRLFETGSSQELVQKFSKLDEMLSAFNIKQMGDPSKAKVDALGNLENGEVLFSSMMAPKKFDADGKVIGNIDPKGDAIGAELAPNSKADPKSVTGQILSYFDNAGNPIQPLIEGTSASQDDAKHILKQLLSYKEGTEVHIHPADWEKVRGIVYDQRFNDLSDKLVRGQLLDATPGSGAAGKDAMPSELDDYISAARITGRVTIDTSDPSTRSISDIATAARRPNGRISESDLNTIRQSHSQKVGGQLTDLNRALGNELLGIADNKASAAEVAAKLKDIETHRTSAQYKLLASNIDPNQRLTPQASMEAMIRGDVINDKSWNELSKFLRAKGVSAAPVTGDLGEKAMAQLGKMGNLAGMIVTAPVSLPIKLGSMLDAPSWRHLGPGIFPPATRRPGTIAGAFAGAALTLTAANLFNTGVSNPEDLGKWGARAYNFADFGNNGLPASELNTTESTFLRADQDPQYFNEQVKDITKIDIAAESRKGTPEHKNPAYKENLEDRTALIDATRALASPALRAQTNGPIAQGLLYVIQKRAGLGTDKIESPVTIVDELRKNAAYDISIQMDKDKDLRNRILSKQLGMTLDEKTPFNKSTAVEKLKNTNDPNSLNWQTTVMYLARISGITDKETLKNVTPDVISEQLKKTNRSAMGLGTPTSLENMFEPVGGEAPSEETIEYKSSAQFNDYIAQKSYLFGINAQQIPAVQNAWTTAAGSDGKMNLADRSNLETALKAVPGIDDAQRNSIMSIALSPAPK